MTNYPWSDLIWSASHWAMLHPTLSWAVFYWALLNPSQLNHTLLSYAAPSRGTPPPLSYATTYLTTLHLLINAAPTELCCTSDIYAASHIATLHPTKLRCTRRSYPTPCELRCTLLSYPTPCELRCTLLSYAVPHWAWLYPTELPNTLRAALHPTELRCTPLSYGAQTLRNEMMNDNLMRKYPWSEKIHVYLREPTNYPWYEVLDKL